MLENETDSQARLRLLPAAYGDEMLAEYMRAQEELTLRGNDILEAIIENEIRMGRSETDVRSEHTRVAAGYVLGRLNELGKDPVPFQTLLTKQVNN